MPQSLSTEKAEAAAIALRAAAKQGFGQAKKTWRLACEVNLTPMAIERYLFTEDSGAMRKWVGPRQIHALKTKAFDIVSDVYENSLQVPVQDIKTDRYGTKVNALRNRGKKGAQLWETLFYRALLAGFTTKCLDDKNFYASDHPMGKSTFSNYQAGASEPWFLMCLDDGDMPFVMQMEAEAPTLQNIDTMESEYVKMNDAFFYGLRAVGGCGYKWPQYIQASKAALTEENFTTLRKNMMKIKNVDGEAADLVPTHIFVGPDNLSAAEKLFKRNQIEGSDNELFGSVEIVKSSLITT